MRILRARPAAVLLPLCLCLSLSLLFSGCEPGGGGGGWTDNEADDLPVCAAGTQVFSVPPVPLEHITGWEPLGHMGPPGHTFPTDHQYLYLRDPGAHDTTPLSVPLAAPAAIRITSLYRSSYGNSGVSDYSVFFEACADVKGRFGHVGSISAALAAAAGPIDQSCSTYEPSPGSPVTQCSSRRFVYDAAAGEQIGTAGDGGSIALDWWLQDRRATPVHFANPARWASYDGGGGFGEGKTVAASDYFTAALSAQIAAKVGRFDGGQPRVVPPLGGTIGVDVDSTARGYWFSPANPAFPPEAYHAALAPDYVTPDTVQAFSIGLSQPHAGQPVPAALYAVFKTRDTGSVNRPFETVRADGSLYCYETRPNAGIVLIRLVDPVTLRLEIRPGVTACAAAAPYAFGVNFFDYKR